MECESRVVVLIDMDCFYCQVEEKLNPELEGKPIAVVQYNPWKGGGIIAVNYVARAMGVTRHMRGDEAKEKCPEIQLPSVPCSRGKADITKYRDAGKDVAKVLQKFTPLLERASIDEAYLDITAPVQERLKSLNVNSITSEHIPNTFALGYSSVEEFLTDIHSCGSDSIEFDYEHARRLLVGAVIVSEIRAAVYEETGYRCSAGIAHNKILAKLVCGMNKPNKQTVLPTHSINILYKTLSLKKVKHLGGKFGDTVCEVLKITKMAELQGFSEKELQNKFDEKNGTWLYNIARGIDQEPVQARFNPKSIGCCKQFKGKAALLQLESLKKWLKDLGDEIEDRLEKDALENNRTPKQMVVSFSTQLPDGRDTSSSRSYNFTADDELCGDFFSNKSLDMLMESAEGTKVKDDEPNRKLKAPIKFLGISVGKFEDNSDAKKTKNITDYFTSGAPKIPLDKKPNDKSKEFEKQSTSKDSGKEYILQKFFQASGKLKDKISEEKNNNTTMNIKKETVMESSLDKQESFFAKLLNKKIECDNRSVESDASLRTNSNTPLLGKPTTPICEVVNCGDSSNDTNYSSSTINMEINKSIALFEEEPNDVEKINNMRQLLYKSTIIDHISVSDRNSEIQDNVEDEPIQQTKVETFTCPECGKMIAIDMVEQHSDYHFAIKLREEDREQVRKERDKKLIKKEDVKKVLDKKPSAVDKTSSITSFLVKICDNTSTETCTECGKKVAVDKLAEHMDFHEAQKLSRELNNKPKILHSSSTSKRKRKSESPTKLKKMPKCKSIDSFFKIL